MSLELVNRHHQQQKLIAVNVIAELHPLWSLLDFHDLVGSTPNWLRASRSVVERGFLTSQYVAAEFVKSYRSAILPHASPLDIQMPSPLGIFGTPAIPDPDIRLRIMVSLKVTGPVYVGNLMPMEETEAMAKGFSKLSGAATRLVLNGGRGMVRLMAGADPEAVGVIGVNDDDNACDSCKFLSTHPMMKADGGRKMDLVAVGHDYCKCSARPVFPASSVN